MDQETIEAAPEFDLNAFPGVGEPAGDWDSEYRSFWSSELGSTSGITGTIGITGTTEITATEEMTATSELQGVIMVSEMIDQAVLGEDAQDFGLIEEVIVDVETGTVEYAVLVEIGHPDPSATGEATSERAQQGELGMRWIPVPLATLGWDAEFQVFTLTVPQRVVSEAPSFRPVNSLIRF